MTLASSTLQIRRHEYEYSGDLNIIIFVGIDTLPFYAINMDNKKVHIIQVEGSRRYLKNGRRTNQEIRLPYQFLPTPFTHGPSSWIALSSFFLELWLEG
ncbi:hypothetical protein MTR_4g134330 [Medicago truncatula]|uniref:Uncharacterized protein n=1 Tax=Medicago truncatula TaxID=3880 RepID=A0A072UTP1_MEDTR|nr:hypothetical protein MTR_4g134330 [Medicago truncatula]